MADEAADVVADAEPNPIEADEPCTPCEAAAAAEAAEAAVALVDNPEPAAVPADNPVCNTSPPAKHRRTGATKRSDYAYPECYLYPVHTAANTRNASSRFFQFKHLIPSSDRRRVAARIDAARRKFGIGDYRQNHSSLQQNPTRRTTTKETSPMATKRKQTAKQKAASLRNLAKARAARRSKARSARSTGGAGKRTSRRTTVRTSGRTTTIRSTRSRPRAGRAAGSSQAIVRVSPAQPIVHVVSRGGGGARRRPAKKRKTARRAAARRGRTGGVTLRLSRGEARAFGRGIASAGRTAGRSRRSTKRKKRAAARRTTSATRRSTAARRRRSGGGRRVMRVQIGRGRSRRIVELIRNPLTGVYEEMAMNPVADMLGGGPESFLENPDFLNNPGFLENPEENPVGSLREFFIAAAGVGAGWFVADFIDRIVATRTPKNGKHAWFGRDAAAIIASRPDGMRLVAGAATTAGFMALSYYLSRKKPNIAYLFGGMATGALVWLLGKIVNFWLMPALMKVDSAKQNAMVFGNRTYPFEQDFVQKFISETYTKWNEPTGGRVAQGQSDPLPDGYNIVRNVNTPMNISVPGNPTAVPAIPASPGVPLVGLGQYPQQSVFAPQPQRYAQPQYAQQRPLGAQQAQFVPTGRVGDCPSCGGNGGCWGGCPQLCPSCPGGVLSTADKCPPGQPTNFGPTPFPVVPPGVFTPPGPAMMNPPMPAMPFPGTNAFIPVSGVPVQHGGQPQQAAQPGGYDEADSMGLN